MRACLAILHERGLRHLARRQKTPVAAEKNVGLEGSELTWSTLPLPSVTGSIVDPRQCRLLRERQQGSTECVLA